MFGQILAVALNTYRESVRARILHGLLGLAVATLGYSLVVGAYALRNQNRAVSHLGSASISIYAIVVAILISSTSLYRELELKTIFPILARPLPRWVYLVGKYLGTVLTLSVFVALNAGLLLFALGVLSGRSLLQGLLIPLGLLAITVLLGLRVPRLRTFLPAPLGLVLFGAGIFFAREAPREMSVVVFQSLFTLLEVSIVTAVTLLFAAFSSPFLTAVFTLAVVVVGRSADTLARLPERVFGKAIHDAGVFLSHVLPNLMVYVPSRALLTGEAVGVTLPAYLLRAGLQSLGWTVLLLVLASLIFRRRDFL